jgi:adenine-specific DNA-methyltransferase
MPHGRWWRGIIRSVGSREAGGSNVPARKAGSKQRADAYKHEHEAILRPEAGTQAQFRKKKPPRTYRYDSSLSPALDWDGNNASRELGEWLIAQIEEATALGPPHRFPERRRFGGVVVHGLDDAVRALKALSKPFLDWAGKAERLSFDVATLPLFVHERLSTKAILETLKSHERDRQMELQLFGDPRLSLAQQLEAYEHQGGWVNRLILGDSLVVMNSLLEYEGLGGQVQMIYIDPPYGVKFGSNFQPFVRRRDVKDADDQHLTREPEMVKAYRDTWELGPHSYLTYVRDRLLLARELLAPTGSLFFQIGDDNLHHVKELLDEVFGSENFVVLICYRRLGMMVGATIQSSAHYLLWYARDPERMKSRKLFERQIAGVGTGDHYTQLDKDGRPYQLISLATGGFRPNTTINYEFEGKVYHPGSNKCWRTTKEGLDRLAASDRIIATGRTLRYKQYLDDFPLVELGTIWTDTGRDPENFYVVQTPSNVVRRCMLMTTDPGDLVMDPTCGSGTTAYTAEQWGRRWITIDVSRVPVALARQRLLTATFPYYKLRDHDRGPAAGFVYKRQQNARAEEVGGIVPHITLKSIANDVPPAEEVLVDRPEVSANITRVTGPFCVEATIPTPLNGEGDSPEGDSEGPAGSLTEWMLEVLRRDPVLHLPRGAAVLRNVRPPAKSLSLSGEATLESDDAPVALVFGPENGAISERLVFEAAKEANARSYGQLIVFGFAIEPNARELIERCEDLVGIPATYVQATPDLVMGDLLKTMRSSQVFSVTGLPDVATSSLPPEEKGGPPRYQVALRGLDVFDPTTMQTDHRSGEDVPAWFLDTDYNDLSFHVSQAFFPRTSAWDSLKRALGAEYEGSVWEHLSGTTSAPFVAGENRRIAVKVIDDRGNELMVVRPLGG